MEEKISVIVPVFNLEEELSRCIKSILSQTYKNIEVIIVDDGSKDNSKEVIEKLAAVDNRVIPVFKENGGVTTARLAGIEKADGEWIGFIDGDDEIEPYMYEMLINNAKKTNAQISHCGYQMVFPDARTNYFHNSGCVEEYDNISAVKELLSGEKIEPGLCNKLYKSELIKKALSKRIDTSVKINEDLLMNYYLFSLSSKSVFEDRCPYHYIVRYSSASRQKLNKNKIYDPIKVKQIIVDDAISEIKPFAEKAYVSTCVYTYCGLTVEKDKIIRKEKKNIRKLIKSQKNHFTNLPQKTKLLAFCIAYAPVVIDLLYPVYAKRFQTNLYS